MHVPVIFISHSWLNGVAYQRLHDIIDTEFAGSWRNVSITRDAAVRIGSREDEMAQRKNIILSELEHIERQLKFHEDQLRKLRSEHLSALRETTELNEYSRIDMIRLELSEQILDPTYQTKLTRLEELQKRHLGRDTRLDAERLAIHIKELVRAIHESEKQSARLGQERQLQRAMLAHHEAEHRQLQLAQDIQLLAELDRVRPPVRLTHKFRVDDLLTRFGALALSIRSRISRSDILLVVAELDISYRQWIEFEYQTAFTLHIPTLAIVNDGEQLSPDLARYGIASTPWSTAGGTIRRILDAREPRPGR